MQYPKKTQSFSAPLCVACSIWKLRWMNKFPAPGFVLLFIHTMVAVVLHEGVSRKIAQSTTLCTVLIYGTF